MSGEQPAGAAGITRFILLCDIARSSRLAESYPQAYAAALDQHNKLVERAVAEHHGEIYKNTGDGYFAFFKSAHEALACAHQLALAFAKFPDFGNSDGGTGFQPVDKVDRQDAGPTMQDASPTEDPFLVRIAVHGGELRPSGREYFGPALNRVSRICQVCHPGQTLASGAVQSMAQPLPDGAELIGLGEHYLRDLNEPEELYQLDDPRLPVHEFPALETLNNRPHNLWKHADTFIGRERELAELSSMLVGQASRVVGLASSQSVRERMTGRMPVPPSKMLVPPEKEGASRLISIVGSGGYGKSRLSRQLLADLLPHYTHGVYIVELEPLNSADAIASATARALKFSFAGKAEPEEQLISFLRNKRMLLCFDNFEHVLDGRTLIEGILRGAPEVQVLITTREPLRVRGEQVYQLNPLPVGGTPVPVAPPSPGVDSMQVTRAEAGATDKAGATTYSDALILFADRARQVNPGFELTPGNAGEVTAICRTLAGIPLAIELAAAWMDSFTLTELHAELTEQLELEARYEDVPGRHRSLRASLDWSWNLLSEEQRETLMRMATFKGGAFADAAGAVVGLEGMKLRKALAGLMDKSWLSTRASAAAAAAGWIGKTQQLGQTRWYMRDAASREYAFEKLEGTKDGGTGFQRGRTGFQPVIDTHRQDTAPTTLYETAVMAHARFFSKWVEQQGPRLHGDGTPSGQPEALMLFELELENILEAVDSLLQRIGRTGFQPVADDGLEAHPTGGTGFQSGRTGFQPVIKGDRQDAGPTMQDASSSQSLLLPITRWLGEFYQAKGKSKEQHEKYSRLFAGLPAASLAELRFWAQYGLGSACWRLGMMDKAIGHAEACMGMVAMVGQASSLSKHRDGEDDRQDASPTKTPFEPSPLNLEPSQLSLLRAYALRLLAVMHRVQGRMDQARERYETSLAIFRELGNRRGEGNSLISLGLLHHHQGQMEEARECYETSLTIFRELGDRKGEGITLNSLGILHSDQGRMDQARECYETSLAIRRELGDRIGEGYTLNNLGVLHWEQGRMEEARECYEAALAISRELSDRNNECRTLDSYAGFLLETGELTRAREMLEQSQRISEELSLKDNLACLHPKWARYWLAVYRKGRTGFQPVIKDDRQDAGPTKQDAGPTKQDEQADGRTGFQPVDADDGLEAHPTGGTGFQPVNTGLTISRRHLPHWRLPGAVYFITWRIHPDAPVLPPEARRIVADSLRHFNQQRYQLYAFVVMDDHVHVLFTPLQGSELSSILHSWKSYTSQQINALLGRKGPLWLDEYFDRIMRDEDEFWEKIQYILNNSQKRWPDIAEYEFVWCQWDTDKVGDGGTGFQPVADDGLEAHPTGGTGFQPVKKDKVDRQDAGPTKQDAGPTKQDAGPTMQDADPSIPATPQAALDKAVHHLGTAKGYLSEIGGTWETEEGQDITTARRAIIEFAARHGFSDQVAELIEEQAAEDRLRAEAE